MACYIQRIIESLYRLISEGCDINETSLYQVTLYNDKLARLDSFYQVSIYQTRYKYYVSVCVCWGGGGDASLFCVIIPTLFPYFCHSCIPTIYVMYILLLLLYWVHSNMKCSSSSITLHVGQRWSSTGMGGL